MTENLTCIIFVPVNTDMHKWELKQRDRQYKILVNKDIWTRPWRQYAVVYHYSLLLSFILDHKSTHLSCQEMWQIWQHTLYDLQAHWRKPPKVSVLIGYQHGWGCAVTASHWDTTLMDYFVTEKTVWQSLYVNVGHYQAKFLSVSVKVKFDKNSFFLKGESVYKGFECVMWYFYLRWIGKGCQVSKLLNYERH